MRKYVTYLFAAAALAVVVTPAQAADNPQKPGNWRMTFQVEMPNMPVKIPAVTKEICVTEEDLKDPKKSLPSNDPKSQCEIADYKIDGNVVSWTMNCPKQNMKGEGRITYTGDTYDGALKMNVNDQEIKTKFSGKWLGACSK